MQNLLTLLTIFWSLNSLAQFDYTDQSALYIKYGITEVNVFFHDSARVVKDEIWKVDFNGRTVYKEFPPLDDDSIYSAITWNYENDLLMNRMHIGVWNMETNKLDTSLTVFIYDSLNHLIREEHTHTRNQDTLIKEYDYSNGLKVKGTLSNTKQHWWSITDSIVYYDSRSEKTVSTTRYFDGYPKYKRELYLDTLGLIQTAIESGFDNNCAVPDRIKTFTYEEGRLIRVKEIFLGTGYVQNVYYSEVLYEYNDQGLITKRLRLNHGIVLNYDTFEYR